MLSLFALTLFISAFLLFWVQLMVAKMILPLLGGAPSVWNTCLFFFQFLLLVGYSYAHLTTTWWKLRYQTLLHVGLLFLPLLILPIAMPSSWIPTQEVNPILWVLVVLLRSVGFPFLMVSTTAPLLQQWFAHTDHPSRHNPYVLYAASNSGSLLGLVSYPLLVEPMLPLTRQSWLWAWGYGLLIGLVGLCAVQVWRSRSVSTGESDSASDVSLDESIQTLAGTEQGSSSLATAVPPTPLHQARWVVLAFLPSSLLLGVTTYLTTDIASIPFLWAVPLALYLLTFILAFARQPQLPAPEMVALLPLVLTALIVLFLLQVTQPAWVLIPLHGLGFFVIARLFHGELSRSRPDPQYLTLFYFWISLGGVLGGWFNAIAAPLLFSTILEYPLALLLSLLLLQQLASETTLEEQTAGFRLARTLPFGVGILLAVLLVGFNFRLLNVSLVGAVLSLGLTAGIGWVFAIKPFRFILALILVVLLNQFSLNPLGRLLATERSFFGVYRVVNERNLYHSLLHGTTLHGKQSLDPARHREPLTYFFPSGPIGQVFQALGANFSHVAILGLGTGALAAYATPDQNWTFYEIDPTDVELAKQYFTYLQDSPAPTQVVLGDGRLAVNQAPANYYDLLVMDAFSSDSIPVHLVTREAVQLYLSKLTQHGLLIINISNRYLDLEPILGALANDLGLASLRQLELTVSDTERKLGKSPSHWVLLARHPEDFGSLRQDPRWQAIPTDRASLWTDNFSDIFRILRAVRDR